MDLPQLLLSPLHHINDYELMFDVSFIIFSKLQKSMINSCSPLGENVAGLPSLRSALALVKETNTIVKESLNSSHFRAQLSAVQRQLTDNPPNIINPKRRFVGQWESKQISVANRTHKNAMVYVFNDMMLIGAPKSKGIFKVVEGMS